MNSLESFTIIVIIITIMVSFAPRSKYIEEERTEEKNRRKRRKERWKKIK